MKTIVNPLFAIALSALLVIACGAGASKENTSMPMQVDVGTQVGTADLSDAFKAYWYQGKAEVNSYSLTQARYGELRNGEAIMIFVTEDFLTDEQVKYEGESNGPRTGILKLNMLERFNTGIYDYSLMTSVFTPVDGTPTLKTTCSVQDWCGQAFVQLNNRKGAYEYELRSYFEKEGDQDGKLAAEWLEDGIWNQVRMDPTQLPNGKVNMVPSSAYLRLTHKPIEAVSVEASTVVNGDTSVFRMDFAGLDRSLGIRFGTASPHVIFGWSETRPDGFGERIKTLTSTAVLTHQVMEPYWGMNANADDAQRERLGLDRMPVR